MRTGIGIHQLYLSITQLIKFRWKAITALLCEGLVARRNFTGCYHVLNSRTFSFRIAKIPCGGGSHDNKSFCVLTPLITISR